MKRLPDNVLIEVIKNDLAAITDEMAITIWKSGRSAMVRSGDFATALCDAQGDIIGQGYAAPFQLGFFMEVMRHILSKFEGQWHPGDVVVSNDPYGGMTHMPDVLVMAPSFLCNQVVGYTMAYSHHTDIGGRFPGGISSKCTSTYEEGIRLPAVKIVSAGKRNEELLQTVLSNVRMPDEWLGDLEAKIAGCRRGEIELGRLHLNHGSEAVQACCNYLIESAEVATIRAFEALPDGSFAYYDLLENDEMVLSEQEIPLAVNVIISGGTINVDFCGTGLQSQSAINLPFSMTKAAVYAVVKGLLDPEVPTNSGFERPIQISAPKGSLVNPNYPAAVGGRAPLFFSLIDMLTRAIAQAQPERVAVPGEGGDVLHFTGLQSDGNPFALLDLFFGGWGGRPNDDGIDGVAPLAFGSYGTLSSEQIEREFPVVIEGFGFVKDSGGAGRFRGSLSVYKKWRFLASGAAIIRTNRLSRPSAGMKGGRAGGLSANILERNGEREVLPKNAHIHLTIQEGDVLSHIIAGSGGHGDPFSRDVDHVIADVHNEKISIDDARELYGVILNSSTLSLDQNATNRLRSSRTYEID